MKKIILLVVMSMIVAVGVAAAKDKGGKGKSGEMSVQVREVQVKSSPNYLGGSIGTVTFGAQVNVTGEEGNWYQIDSPSGWIPKSALTSHKSSIKAAKKVTGASSVSHDEVALAGKGFNPQVEAQYKRDNADIAQAFVSVDKVEGIDVPDAQLKQFQVAGKLKNR